MSLHKQAGSGRAMPSFVVFELGRAKTLEVELGSATNGLSA